MYRIIYVFRHECSVVNRLALVFMTLSLSCTALASGDSDSGSATVRSLFENIPDTIIPLIPHSQLLDFADYLNNNMKAEVKNRLGSTSEMTVLTDDYTHIRLTPSSDFQIQLLPYKSDKIILTVHSYFLNDSTADSSLRFYNLKWQPLPVEKYKTLIDKTEHPQLRIRQSDTPVISPSDTNIH